MIKDYVIIAVSLLFKPFLPIFLHKLNNTVVHIAFIKLGGLSKYIDTLCTYRPYNLITNIRLHNTTFIVIYICGLPFFIAKKTQSNSHYLSTYMNQVNCLYHVHQLSHDIHDDYNIISKKHYIITLHDYYWVCRRFFMLDPSFKFCNMDGRCGHSMDREIEMFRILKNADKIIIPDTSMLQYLRQVYNYAPFLDNIQVIPHGI